MNSPTAPSSTPKPWPASPVTPTCTASSWTDHQPCSTTDDAPTSCPTAYEKRSTSATATAGSPTVTDPPPGVKPTTSFDWELGGHTRPDNLVLLCSRHHHILHLNGWKHCLHPDNTFEVLTPDGRTQTKAGHPRAPGRGPTATMLSGSEALQAGPMAAVRRGPSDHLGRFGHAGVSHEALVQFAPSETNWFSPYVLGRASNGAVVVGPGLRLAWASSFAVYPRATVRGDRGSVRGTDHADLVSRRQRIF